MVFVSKGTFLNDKNIIFKRNINGKYFLKLVISFLNSENGIICIGIDKNKKVIGIKNADKICDKIQKMLKKILPICNNFVNIEVKKIDNLDVIYVNVQKGTGFFYYLKEYGRSEKGCFEFEKGKAKSIKENVIQDYFNNQLLDISDIRSKSGSKFVFNFFNDFLIKNNKKELFNLLKTDEKFNLLAELLADNNNINVNLFIFSSKDKSDILKHISFSNECLIKIYQDVYRYMEDLNEKIEHNKRKHYFDFELFNEALVNAFVHNNWKNNRSLSISIFSNRIEVFSFKEQKNKDIIKKGISLPINKRLMDIFVQCGIAKGIGYGSYKIIEKYGKKVYKVDDEYVLVSLPLKINKNFFKDDRKEKIINLIKKNPTITIEKMARLLKLSTSTIARELKKNNIVNKGSDKKVFREIF